uniref:Secreted protein n=1 Tax=Anguilla anguilla TaxID=7936 RepID=A0A0E9WE87_ANGAN
MGVVCVVTSCGCGLLQCRVFMAASFLQCIQQFSLGTTVMIFCSSALCGAPPPSSSHCLLYQSTSHSGTQTDRDL